MRLVTSKDNALLKKIKLLSHSGRERKKQGLTVLDGDHLIAAALEADFPMETVVFSERGWKVYGSAFGDRIKGSSDIVLTSDSVFEACSSLDAPSGVMAVIRIPRAENFPNIRDRETIVLLDKVQDSGNLGTIFRTIAAVGLRRVFLTEECAQAWSPKVMRAGMGGHFLLEIHEGCDPIKLISEFGGVSVATSISEQSIALYDSELARPLLWMFGSEGQGLSKLLLDRADLELNIPMATGLESLNVATSVGVCLYEQKRQMLQKTLK